MASFEVESIPAVARIAAASVSGAVPPPSPPGLDVPPAWPVVLEPRSGTREESVSTVESAHGVDLIGEEHGASGLEVAVQQVLRGDALLLAGNPHHFGPLRTHVPYRLPIPDDPRGAGRGHGPDDHRRGH